MGARASARGCAAAPRRNQLPFLLPLGEARDRNNGTSNDQMRLQASLIRQKHYAFRSHLPAGLGFRQGQTIPHLALPLPLGGDLISARALQPREIYPRIDLDARCPGRA